LPRAPRALLEETLARTMLAYSLFIGSYFVKTMHGERTRAQVLQLAVDRLLEESWD
jgi:hypothetical protein